MTSSARRYAEELAARGRVSFMIKVCPRAGCSELFEDGSGLAARLKAAPEDGRANAELLRLLERTFKAEATIVRGRDSRRKTILLRN